jgi:hypothetical protein
VVGIDAVLQNAFLEEVPFSPRVRPVKGGFATSS